MKHKKKIITIIVSIIVVIGLLTAGGIKMCSYVEASRLCREIKEGKEISTKFSNGTTAPKFLRGITVIMQIGGPKIPLVEACYYGNIQAVRVLLENGADPNFCFKGDWGTLDGVINGVGTNEKSFEIIKLLVEHGADVNEYGSHGPIIFQLTSTLALTKEKDTSMREKIILYLLDNGAYRFNENGSTVLQYAVAGDKINLTKSLIEEYGFSINGEVGTINTPLMIAADRNCINVLNYLLEAGADKTIKNNEGKTAYDIAVEKGYTELAELLKLE